MFGCWVYHEFISSSSLVLWFPGISCPLFRHVSNDLWTQQAGFTANPLTCPDKKVFDWQNHLHESWNHMKSAYFDCSNYPPSFSPSLANRGPDFFPMWWHTTRCWDAPTSRGFWRCGCCRFCRWRGSDLTSSATGWISFFVPMFFSYYFQDFLARLLHIVTLGAWFKKDFSPNLQEDCSIMCSNSCMTNFFESHWWGRFAAFLLFKNKQERVIAFRGLKLSNEFFDVQPHNINKQIYIYIVLGQPCWFTVIFNYTMPLCIFLSFLSDYERRCFFPMSLN